MLFEICTGQLPEGPKMKMITAVKVAWPVSCWCYMMMTS